MNKKTWMEQLDRALSREGMTREEKRAVLNYYDEMYQDKRDDGAREEDILKEFGFPEDVVQNVLEEGSRRKEKANYRTSPDFHADTEPYREPYRENVKEEPNYRRAPQEPTARQAQPYGAPYQAPKKRSGGCVLLLMSPFTLIAGFAGLILMIVLFSVAIGLCIGGVAAVISSFTMIAVMPGVFFIALGSGILIFALGGLLFWGSAAFARAWGRYMKWGFTGKGGNL